MRMMIVVVRGSMLDAIAIADGFGMAAKFVPSNATVIAAHAR